MGKHYLAVCLHIGIKDIQTIFQSFNHTLEVKSLSDHHLLMGWNRAQVDICNQYTWRNLNQEMCDAFYERYKDEFSQYDGFICFYPPTFSMLYEKFNKPVIVQAPIRYEVPFHNNADLWNHFNDYLRKGIDKKKIILLANNKYDKEYLQGYIQRKVDLIPSLCEYTSTSYTGKRNQFLYCSKLNNFMNFIKVPNIINKSMMKNFSWKDIAEFKAIVHIPYAPSIMTLFEQYTANIPLLFPSKEFLIQLWQQYSDQGLMSEASWRQIHRLSPKSIIKYNHKYDPNNYKSLTSFKHWLSLSDFYDTENMPYVEHFNSISELEYKLYTLDFQKISDRMKVFNVSRKERILNKWEKILNRI